MTYKTQFSEAVRFTESLGFVVPSFAPHDGEFVTAANGERVLHHMAKGGVTDIAASALQCLKWSHALQHFVEAGLGCGVTLTIGQVSVGTRSVYNPSKSDFSRWAKDGIGLRDFASRSGFNFHTWYTLPTMEILDLTLWSSLAVAWQMPEMRGNVVGGWPDLIAPNPVYTPMVAGTAYPEHVHSISQVPLLSANRSFNASGELY